MPSPAATSSSPMPTSSRRRAWHWCSCCRSVRAIEETPSKGSLPSSGPPLQRELDVTPTRVRIVLSTEPVSTPAEATAGYDGYVQGGRCESPTGDVHVDLKNRDDDDARRDAVPGHLSRDRRPRHRRLLRIRRRTWLRCGRRLHRPGLLAGDRGTSRASRQGAATSSNRTRRSSRTPDWLSCRSCRSVRPACRDSPSWTGWRCSVSSTSRPRSVRIILSRPARHRRLTTGPAEEARAA